MKLNKLVLLGLILFIASAISAQDVISANELAKISKNKDVVIVWSGAESGYKVHITGSVSVPHSTLYNNEPVKSVIKPAAEMANLLGAKGISTDKTIVVYDEGSGRYSGRMYWILKYLGAPNVKMLNGNLTAWKASRKPITGAPTKMAASTFTAKVDASILTSMEEVKTAVGNSSYVLIDARAPEEFAGTAVAEFRKGHIPGAVNIDYKNVMDAKGLLKTNEQLKSLFESKGVTPDKTVIIYCETSVRAGVVHLALKGLGYPKVKVYDSAYLEWQATSSNKVE